METLKNSRIIKNILFLLLILSFIVSFKTFFSENSLKEIIFSFLYYPNFFINYSQGFVKRGLDGTTAELLSLFLNISSLKIIYIYKLINLFILSFFILKSIKKMSIDGFLIIILMICFFHFIDHFLFTNKDPILFTIYILTFYFFKKNKDKLAIIMMVIGILIHEVFYFFSFVPVFFYLFKYRTIKLALLTSILLTGIFLCVSFIFNGKGINITTMVNNFPNNANYFYEIIPKKFPIGTFEFSSQYLIWNIISDVKGYFYLLWLFFINYIFMFFCIKCFFSKSHYKFMFFIFNMQTLLLILLSIIACDFSRWFILFNFSILCLSFFIEKDSKFIIRNRQYANTLLFLLFFTGTPEHSGLLSYNHIAENIPANNLKTLITP